MGNKKITPRVLSWMPKGADMSPLDFCVWGYMDKKSAEYREKTPAEDEYQMRAALLAIHANMPQSIVVSRVALFKERATRLKTQKEPTSGI